VAFIAVAEPSLQVDATAPTRRTQTVEEWARENDALVAVNGDFYRYVAGLPHVYGDAVGGGERWPEVQTGRGDQYVGEWFHGRYGWVAFGGSGVIFTHTRYTKKQGQAVGGWRPDDFSDEIPSHTRALISGFPQLVVEGNPVECADPTAKTCFPDRSDMWARHPRTAIGVSRDQQTLILVVVDGRSRESVGVYGSELARLMHELGAWTAINFDGGGSSQFYVKGRGVINTPSGTPHRRVLNHLGVFPQKNLD
jgi:exopolysaccharide biosynthesis protein